MDRTRRLVSRGWRSVEGLVGAAVRLKMAEEKAVGEGWPEFEERRER